MITQTATAWRGFADFAGAASGAMASEDAGMDKLTLSQALTIASGIFDRIALDIEWRHNLIQCPADAIHMTIRSPQLCWRMCSRTRSLTFSKALLAISNPAS
jgi:hypothetical protein